MKVTSKIQHELKLELTEEQKEAFCIVDDFIRGLYDFLQSEKTDGICNNAGNAVIMTEDLEETWVFLETMLNAPSFGYIEDTD